MTVLAWFFWLTWKHLIATLAAEARSNTEMRAEAGLGRYLVIWSDVFKMGLCLALRELKLMERRGLKERFVHKLV
jgi:hypothetical protein